MEDFSNVFLMQSRPFGEYWAQNYLLDNFRGFRDPHEYDPNFKNEYDLLYQIDDNNFIKIEVKAARMLKAQKDYRETLLDRAATVEEKYEVDRFSFLQIKSYCADVFVLMCVFKDGIKYFVFSANDIVNYDHYSDKQHRGNVGEGQISVSSANFDELLSLEVPKSKLTKAIVEAYNSIA